MPAFMRTFLVSAVCPGARSCRGVDMTHGRPDVRSHKGDNGKAPCAFASSLPRRSISAAAAAPTSACRCWPRAAAAGALGGVRDAAPAPAGVHARAAAVQPRPAAVRGFRSHGGLRYGWLPHRRGHPAHVAALKGVIADEVRFERGLTRLTMAMQARLRAAARAARGSRAGHQPLLGRARARVLRAGASRPPSFPSRSTWPSGAACWA